LNPTDKKNRSVALRYEQKKDPAPRVVAKGQGQLARKINEEARAHGVPVREDPMLVEALMGLELYQEIPEELYQVIAEVFAFLYRIKNRAGFSQQENNAG
jgi:flagellar biosynthesis protein